MTFEVDQTADTEQSPSSLDTRDITQNQSPNIPHSKRMIHNDFSPLYSNPS